MSTTITNAEIVLIDRVIERGTVRVDDGRITAIEEGGITTLTETDAIVDARGATLVPGAIDLHNDNLEFEINPRVGAGLPFHFALGTMERRLAGAGVTTEFHAVSFQENLGKGRSIDDATRKAEAIADLEDDDRRPVRHAILHRLDVRTPAALACALPSLRRVRTAYVSLNDHTPGQGQYRDIDRLIAMAEQSHASRGHTEPFDRDFYRKRMEAHLADDAAVRNFYATIADELTRTPMTISTHDDDSAAKVDAQLTLGASVAEFPITFEAAQHARDNGMTILVGSPNIVRGGSQSGNLSAIELAAAGLADAICADYHAPCILPAAWKLVDLGICSLPAAVAMITANPARAVGLHDRGEIALGKLADLALVRRDDRGTPHVEVTFIAGRQTFAFAPWLGAPVAAAVG